MRNGIAGWSFNASAMNCLKAGAATAAPVSRLPRLFGWSKPTNTPHTRSGENPTNHTSLASFDVPVLPASGLPTAITERPVPRNTTPSSSDTI